ncbi:MAG: ABC transporter substrate-binding protein [Spirochaetota bacterium]
MPGHTPALAAFLFVAALGAAAASGTVEPAGASEGPGSPAGPEPRPLTVGLMPAVDSIPLIVAEAEGYFGEEGIDVTLEVFRDQLYREAALGANTIDATVSDLVNAIRSWANGADYRVISSTQGGFSIVTSSTSGIDSPEEWPAAPETVPTGLLEDSIINYTAQRMLEAAGLDPTRIEIVPTMQIPVRMEMLVAGELDAAVLPEPVTRMATAAGATELLSTDVLDWTPGVLLATGTALREKPRELEALLRAYDRAVEAVNADPDAFREVIVARAAFPPPTAATMRIPAYRPASVPSAAQVADVAEWMLGLGLIESLPPHDAIVRPRPFDR